MVRGNLWKYSENVAFLFMPYESNKSSLPKYVDKYATIWETCICLDEMQNNPYQLETCAKNIIRYCNTVLVRSSSSVGLLGNLNLM